MVHITKITLHVRLPVAKWRIFRLLSKYHVKSHPMFLSHCVLPIRLLILRHLLM